MRERRFLPTALLVVLCLLPITACGMVRSDFTAETDLEAWVPNAHMADVRIDEGVVKAKSVGSDPFLLCRTVDVEATPWQYVVVRMKADRPGTGELFWSGQLQGQYGGLAEAKKVRFAVRDTRDWQEIVLFPFWHTEGTIRQLRLDLYDGAEFEIDWIEIRDWGRHLSPSDTPAWDLGPNVHTWQIHPNTTERFAPPVAISTTDKTWVTVQLTSNQSGIASILWATDKTSGLQSEAFGLRGDGRAHDYDIYVAGLPAWQNNLVAFGIRLPEEARVQIHSVQIGSEPQGPGRLEVSYFGFEDGVNRAGRPCKILAQIANHGGRPQSVEGVHLTVPPQVTVISRPKIPGHPGIEYGDFADFTWTVKADKPGGYRVTMTFSGNGSLPPHQTTLHFTTPPAATGATYVPEPRPVRTDLDVCAFYFPGWESDGKWDCIRRVAPIRKPLLGYYDESNPECVDWQIKWAVENGISCFLVDWYWVQGHQHLTHWFEAYRKARYRDHLKVAIMWANHNPPGTHSAEDWLAVTQHWIDRYFNLPGYYMIEGKPAVFIWDTRAIRADLGGTEAVRRVFEKSQAMVKSAGFGGMTLIAMENAFSAGLIGALGEEGYAGVTTYHEWGSTTHGDESEKRFRYEDVVRTSPAAWRHKQTASGSLTYYPLVDTGWDSRPWHGNKAMAIEGRTPALFEQLLQQARSFCRENRKDIVVLGPVNEWGEGSYIEPCTEFGFDMIEAVRRVFADGPVSSWPINLSPADIGLGPYGLPPRPMRTSWTFNDDVQGWAAMMNVDRLLCRDGMLQFHTTSFDPALVVTLNNVKASAFSKIQIRMQLKGQLPQDAGGQLFWSQGGAAITEASSVRFALNLDEAMHTYEIDLASHARWRGRITSLRLDPCSSQNIDVAIDEIRLIE